jgi:hypothetical protein
MSSSIDNHATELGGASDREAPANAQNQTRIRKGQVIALFAFDVGYEVSLVELKSEVPDLIVTHSSPLAKKADTGLYAIRPSAARSESG